MVATVCQLIIIEKYLLQNNIIFSRNLVCFLVEITFVFSIFKVFLQC